MTSIGFIVEENVISRRILP